MVRSFCVEVGRSGVECLYSKGYRPKEIAKVYDISESYFYSCLRQLYGHNWKETLNKKKEVFGYEKQYI
jgi:hypothetical protein